MKNKEVAELIGASSSVTWKTGDNFFTIRVQKKGKWHARKVRELSENESKKFKQHGPAWGMNVGHCMYLANKFWKEFKERVCGYRVIPSDRKDCPVSVIFYEKS